MRVTAETAIPFDDQRVYDALDAVFGQRKGFAIEQNFIPEEVADAQNARMGEFRWMIPDDKELRIRSSRRPFYPQPRNFMESRLASRGLALHAFGRKLETVTGVYGRERDIEALAGWRYNRMILNRMRGTELKPAIIQPHDDPERFVFLYALGLEEADGTIGGEHHKLSKGSLEAFIGKKLAEELGITQPNHTVTTTHRRHSPVFAQDTTPPLDFATISATAHRVGESFMEFIRDLDRPVPA